MRFGFIPILHRVEPPYLTPFWRRYWLTNRIDAVVVDRSAGSRTLNAKPWSTWADVEGTFDKWAKGVREAIDKAHGR